jgi:hypothetical protein
LVVVGVNRSPDGLLVALGALYQRAANLDPVTAWLMNNFLTPGVRNVATVIIESEWPQSKLTISKNLSRRKSCMALRRPLQSGRRVHCGDGPFCCGKINDVASAGGLLTPTKGRIVIDGGSHGGVRRRTDIRRRKVDSFLFQL